MFNILSSAIIEVMSTTDRSPYVESHPQKSNRARRLDLTFESVVLKKDLQSLRHTMAEIDIYRMFFCKKMGNYALFNVLLLGVNGYLIYI